MTKTILELVVRRDGRSAQSSGMSELFVGMGVSVGTGVNVGAKLVYA